MYLEPAHVEEELEERKERKDEIASVTSAGTLVQRLSTHQTRQEEQVNSDRHHLASTPTKNVFAATKRLADD